MTLTIWLSLLFVHPILASHNIHIHLPLLFLSKWTPKFYHNFLTKVTLAKVTKCPWPLAFRSDGLDFISILERTIATEKWKISAVPIQMPKEPKLTLPQNRPRSTKGHDLYKFCSTTNSDATCQLSRPFAQWFGKEEILRFWAFLSMAAILVMWPAPFISSAEPTAHRWAYRILMVRRPSVVRPSVVRRPSVVNNFKLLLLWNRLANQSQILCRASLGRRNESLFAASESHDQNGRHAHIW